MLTAVGWYLCLIGSVVSALTSLVVLRAYLGAAPGSECANNGCVVCVRISVGAMFSSVVPAPVTPSNSATMMGLVEPTPSPSPPILGLTSPRGTNQLPTPFSPHPTQPAMPLLPSPDISAPFRYGRVRVGPSSVLPRPSADEAAVAPHLRYLVMALGSTTLRYGTADEFQPRSKAMAVAYRAKGADGRKRRKTGEERKEANGGMDEMKDVSVDLPMKGEEKKEKPQSRVATSSAASRAGVAAQVAAWHEQAGEDFTVLNAEVIKRRVQPVNTAANRAYSTHRRVSSPADTILCLCLLTSQPPKPKFFDEYDVSRSLFTLPHTMHHSRVVQPADARLSLASLCLCSPSPSTRRTVPPRR